MNKKTENYFKKLKLKVPNKPKNKLADLLLNQLSIDTIYYARFGMSKGKITITNNRLGARRIAEYASSKKYPIRTEFVILSILSTTDYARISSAKYTLAQAYAIIEKNLNETTTDDMFTYRELTEVRLDQNSFSYQLMGDDVVFDTEIIRKIALDDAGFSASQIEFQ